MCYTTMNNSAQGNDPIKDMRGSKDPFKSTPYVDPLKQSPDTYKDPLSVPKESYEDPVISEVKLPEYHEYVLPDIDPVTEKPRKKLSKRTHTEEEPKENKRLQLKPFYRPQQGSSVDSVRRTLRIQENLNF
ncbi:uncharacterized protein LOC123563203 [Mercenaria mercenaria]|uniref:uncharacterized protein LOC123563203 n=1 Tax=Mercenaria mercenaria TaxID=6596 RepID=UPI00234F2101|nr:uncharacterized protein LOC123563203 [Mercenaria mercenaria]